MSQPSSPADRASISADALRAYGLPVIGVTTNPEGEPVIELEDPRGGTFSITVKPARPGWSFTVSARTIGPAENGSWSYASIYDETLSPEIIQVIYDDLAANAAPGQDRRS